SVEGRGWPARCEVRFFLRWGTYARGDAHVVDGIPPYDGQREQPPGPHGSPASAIRRILHQLGHLHVSCAAAVEGSRLALSRFPEATGDAGRPSENGGGR